MADFNVDEEKDSAVSGGQDMFATNDTTAITQIGEMAERLAIDMGEEEDRYKAHKTLKAANEAAKEQLNRAMTEAGMESCKLACGLTPRTRTTERVSKASGVDDDSLFEWLRTPRVNVAAAIQMLENTERELSGSSTQLTAAIGYLHSLLIPTIELDRLFEEFPDIRGLGLRQIATNLGDIIKETVHHGTLTSTMKEHRDMGNELPESMFQVSLRPTITMGGKAAYLAAKGGG